MKTPNNNRGPRSIAVSAVSLQDRKACQAAGVSLFGRATHDLNVLDLHVLALSPPNCSIPLKHFLFGFQSQRRTERASPEGVG